MTLSTRTARAEDRRSALSAATLARRSAPEFRTLAEERRARLAAADEDRRARAAAERARTRPASPREIDRARRTFVVALADARADFPDVPDVDLVHEIGRAVALDLRPPVARALLASL